MNLRAFADEVSMDSPAPGGGSVAALCGALSAALSAMVGNLTYGKKGYEGARPEMKRVALRAQSLKDDLLRAVDLDTRAFNRVMESFRLSKGTEEQARERDRAVEEASKEATLVPFGVLEAWRSSSGRRGRRPREQELGERPAWLASRPRGRQRRYYNVRINLPGINEEAFKTRIGEQAEARSRSLKVGGRRDALMDAASRRRNALEEALPPPVEESVSREGEECEDDDRGRGGDVEREGEAEPEDDRRDADGRGYENGLPEARGRLKSGRGGDDHEGGDEQDPTTFMPRTTVTAVSREGRQPPRPRRPRRGPIPVERHEHELGMAGGDGAMMTPAGARDSQTSGSMARISPKR
jgi:glutamate formiminotransferase/formiminotetrahydrofolate cyclodeaminase